MKSRWLFYPLFLFWSFTAYAVNMPSLYQVELPVSTQLEDARSDAMKEGFAQVLVKLTGNPDVVKNASVKDAISKAEYYVSEYHYLAPTPNASTYFIQITYEKNDIGRLLKHAGLHVLAENRPLILVWMIIDDGISQDILSNEQNFDIAHAIKASGQKYGLPVIFPMMDVSDVSLVSADDINQMKISLLKTAGVRYTPDVLLVGRVQKDKDVDIWRGTWKLSTNNNEWNFELKNEDSADLFDQLFLDINKVLSKQYGKNHANQPLTWLTLQISQITQSHDLADLVKLLKQLTIVQQVELSEVTGDKVEISILISGNLQTFRNQALVKKHFIFRSEQANKNELSYAWKSIS